MMGLLAALVLGLFGSLHCVGMCGPLALALPRGAAGRGRFIAGRAFYQLGRVVTYTLLGVAFGLMGGAARLAGAQQVLSVGLGAAILLYLILPKRITERVSSSRTMSGVLARLKSWLAPLMRSNRYASQFGVGLLNGLLPCGMIYVALAGALAQPSIVESAAFMTLFGLGTLPAMMAVSLAPGFVSTNARTSLRRMMPVGTAVIAVLLIVRGLALGIPYLSPKTPTSFAQSAAVPSCHHH
jgi:sulfite exporter TauE/SafE